MLDRDNRDWGTVLDRNRRLVLRARPSAGPAIAPSQRPTHRGDECNDNGLREGLDERRGSQPILTAMAIGIKFSGTTSTGELGLGACTI